jgi:hypothetical protein
MVVQNGGWKAVEATEVCELTILPLDHVDVHQILLGSQKVPHFCFREVLVQFIAGQIFVEQVSNLAIVSFPNLTKACMSPHLMHSLMAAVNLLKSGVHT